MGSVELGALKWESRCLGAAANKLTVVLHSIFLVQKVSVPPFSQHRNTTFYAVLFSRLIKVFNMLEVFSNASNRRFFLNSIYDLSNDLLSVDLLFEVT